MTKSNKQNIYNTIYTILLVIVIVVLSGLLISKTYKKEIYENIYNIYIWDENDTSINKVENELLDSLNEQNNFLNNTLVKQQELYGFIIASLSILLATFGIYNVIQSFIDKKVYNERQNTLDKSIENTEIQINKMKAQMTLLKLSREYNAINKKPNTKLFYGEKNENIVSSKEGLTEYLDELCKEFEYLKVLDNEESLFTMISLIKNFSDYSIKNKFSEAGETEFDNHVYRNIVNQIKIYFHDKDSKRYIEELRNGLIKYLKWTLKEE